MVVLRDAVLEYFMFMEARGLAPATIRTSRNIMSHAQRAWGEEQEISELEARHVDAVFIGKDWSTGTRNIYLGALRGFLKWCRTHRYLPPDFDPTQGWTSRPVEKRERTWLTLPVLRALMNVPEHPRDRAFIAVGIYTFMRASEITSLRIGDIDVERHELRMFRHKTKQQDRLPICLELEVELVRWLRYYEQEQGELNPDWFLLPSRGPRPMAGVHGKRRLEPTGELCPLRPTKPIARPQRIIKEAMAELGVGEHGDGCHVMRRSGARALYEQLREMGHDGAARRVQSMLGHASLVMTEKYLGLNHERMQRNEMLAGRTMFGAPDRDAVGRGHLRALESA